MSGTSIRHLWEKLKHLLSDDGVYVSCLLIVVAVAAFGLGRSSVLVSPSIVDSTPAVRLTTTPAVAVAAATTTHETVVASKNGTRYHLPTCPGALQIREANKITFGSPEEARAAGFTPAANCPELSQ